MERTAASHKKYYVNTAQKRRNYDVVYEKIAITVSGTTKADQKSINSWSRMISFGR